MELALTKPTEKLLNNGWRLLLLIVLDSGSWNTWQADSWSAHVISGKLSPLFWLLPWSTCWRRAKSKTMMLSPLIHSDHDKASARRELANLGSRMDQGFTCHGTADNRSCSAYKRWPGLAWKSQDVQIEYHTLTSWARVRSLRQRRNKSCVISVNRGSFITRRPGGSVIPGKQMTLAYKLGLPSRALDSVFGSSNIFQMTN